MKTSRRTVVLFPLSVTSFYAFMGDLRSSYFTSDFLRSPMLYMILLSSGFSFPKGT
jgi:hypothetical protein